MFDAVLDENVSNEEVSDRIDCTSLKFSLPTPFCVFYSVGIS